MQEIKNHLTIQIREANLDDVNYIAELKTNDYQGDFHPYYVDNVLKKLFINEFKKRWKQKVKEGMNTLVMTEDDKLIGFISYSINQIPAEIDCIFLLPPSRGKHYGKKLLNRAFEQIKKTKSEEVIAWILEENVLSREFFEHLGFQPTSNHREETIAEDTILKEIEYRFKLPVF